MTDTLLRDRRKQLGLTMRDVVEQINSRGPYNLSINSLGNYEAAAKHASPQLLVLICQILELDPLPVLAARGLLHPALTDALKHDAEAQRTALAALGITLP